MPRTTLWLVKAGSWMPSINGQPDHPTLCLRYHDGCRLDALARNLHREELEYLFLLTVFTLFLRDIYPKILGIEL
jgi:hypothetical protein